MRSGSRSGDPGVAREPQAELVGAMLSPEAERVLQYLVEVEELAEEVLADKRQVRGPSAALGSGGRRRGKARGVAVS